MTVAQFLATTKPSPTIQPCASSQGSHGCPPFPTLRSSVETWLEQTVNVGSGYPKKRKRSSSLPSRIDLDKIANSLAVVQPGLGGIPTPDIPDMGMDQTQALATPPRTTSAYNPSTPSSSSKRSFRTPRDAGWVSSRLKQHGIVYTAKATLDRFPAFKTKVEDLLNAGRDSAMKPASVQRFANRLEYEESSNEDTLLVNLIPLIVKDHYTQRSATGSEKNRAEVESANVEELKLREWFDEGLTYKYNIQFRSNALPNSHFTKDDDFDPELAKALSKEDGMLNPKPDYVFGLRIDKFDSDRPTGVMLESEIAALLQVVPNMYHPFLIIEGKSNKGVIGDAEIQARRGGAALVNVGRKLLALTRPRESLLQEGPDEETFVFSATITPQIMEFYLHWAELGVPEGTKYHMTYLKSFALRDPEALPELRRFLHNILDFGCVERMAEMRKLHEKLYAYQKSETTTKLTQELSEREGKGTKRQRLDLS